MSTRKPHPLPSSCSLARDVRGPNTRRQVSCSPFPFVSMIQPPSRNPERKAVLAFHTLADYI